MVILTIFTTPTCPKCAHAKEVVCHCAETANKQGKHVEVEMIDASTNDGLMRAAELNVGLTVPKVVINHSDDIDTHLGVNDISEVRILSLL